MHHVSGRRYGRRPARVCGLAQELCAARQVDENDEAIGGWVANRSCKPASYSKMDDRPVASCYALKGEMKCG